MNPTEQAKAIIELRNKRPEYITQGPLSRKVEIDRLRDDMADRKLNDTPEEQFATETMEHRG